MIIELIMSKVFTSRVDVPKYARGPCSTLAAQSTLPGFSGLSGNLPEISGTFLKFLENVPRHPPPPTTLFEYTQPHPPQIPNGLLDFSKCQMPINCDQKSPLYPHPYIIDDTILYRYTRLRHSYICILEV